MVFWQEIKTPAHLRHCRDSSKVKSLPFGPAMSPESPAPREPGIQMTGALCPQQMLVYKGGQINNVQLFTGVRIREMSQLQNCSVMCTKNGSYCEYEKNKLDLMFMKHYAPNRCLYIKVAKLRTGVGSAKMSYL